jgi:hypothetical protein
MGLLIIFLGQTLVKEYFVTLQWKEADGSQLMDSKLKCLFVLPESNGGVNEATTGNRESWQSTGITSGNGDNVPIKVTHRS